MKQEKGEKLEMGIPLTTNAALRETPHTERQSFAEEINKLRAENASLREQLKKHENCRYSQGLRDAKEHYEPIIIDRDSIIEKAIDKLHSDDIPYKHRVLFTLTILEDEHDEERPRKNDGKEGRT